MRAQLELGISNSRPSLSSQFLVCSPQALMMEPSPESLEFYLQLGAELGVAH